MEHVQPRPQMEYMPPELASILVMMADNSPKYEICGFILSDWTHIPIRNISASPWKDFHMHPGDQLAAVSKGADISGVYHSHPGGSTELSQRDVDGWPKIGKAYCRYWLLTSEHSIEFGRWDKGDDHIWGPIWGWSRPGRPEENLAEQIPGGES